MLDRDRYRPRDCATVLVVVAELHQRGLSARDIAEALGLTEHAMRQMLGEQPAAQEQGAA
ncbi:MAG: hypothetical protein M0038_06710 [Pseudomonadota bacterium]|jgi:predicted ArsR family transcriptional regulator|nr:hypothetical protein [Pseudomonadota bacterium]